MTDVEILSARSRGPQLGVDELRRLTTIAFDDLHAPFGDPLVGVVPMRTPSARLLFPGTPAHLGLWGALRARRILRALDGPQGRGRWRVIVPDFSEPARMLYVLAHEAEHMRVALIRPQISMLGRIFDTMEHQVRGRLDLDPAVVTALLYVRRPEEQEVHARAAHIVTEHFPDFDVAAMHPRRDPGPMPGDLAERTIAALALWRAFGSIPDDLAMTPPTFLGIEAMTLAEMIEVMVGPAGRAWWSSDVVWQITEAIACELAPRFHINASVDLRDTMAAYDKAVATLVNDLRVTIGITTR